MVNYEIISSNELYHHGIKGQKWGIRHDRQPTGNGRGRKKNSPSYSKKQIADHRKKMIDHYSKMGDKETAKEYKKLSDKDVAKDLANRDHDAKLLKGLAISVGVAAAIGIGYYAYQRRAVGLAIKTAAKNGADISDLLNSGASVKVSTTILKEVKRASKNGANPKDILSAVKRGSKNKAFVFDAKHNLIDGKGAKEILKASGDDLDLTIRHAKLQRADGSDNFDLSKARRELFVSVLKKDADRYSRMNLPTNPNSRSHLYQMEMMKDIDIPSRKKADKMIKDLYEKDPAFKDSMIKGAQEAVRARGGDISEQKLDQWFTNGATIGFTKKSGEYFRNWSMATQNEAGSKKMRELFKDYDGVIDAHDILDGVGDFPIVMFNDEKFRKNVKVTKIR